jgi:4'-phosphopantetheinyl transferase
MADVMLWDVDLDAVDEPDARSCLDDAESLRAARRRSHIDRRRFIAAHVALRVVLAELLDVMPREIEYVVDGNRKPFLAPHLNAGAWQFNLSHSGNRGMIAVTSGRRIGVDVEVADKPYGDLVGIAKSFSAIERAQLGAVPADEAAMAFYRCWTRKEAFLKAIGTGVSGRMDAFSVSADADARFLAMDADFGSCEDWSLVALDDRSKRYAAALAVEARDVSIARRSVRSGG